MHFIALAQVENHPLSLQRIYNNSRNERRKINLYSTLIDKLVEKQ